MERKRINNIDEIWDGNNLLLKDFSNLDLSNIDLSIIPMNKWIKCIFCNTDVNNTNINLPNENRILLEIDYQTIINNPNLKLPSIYISAAILFYLSKDDKIHPKLDENRRRKLVFGCEKILKYDSQGYLKTLYNIIKDNLNLREKYLFFAVLAVNNQHISNIYINTDLLKFLTYYYFSSCTFENITLDCNLKEIIFNTFDEGMLVDFVAGSRNTYNSIIMPKVTYNDWPNIYFGKRSIASSFITFTTKVYLELSRACNARCPFCRNQTFDKTKYDLKQIINTLHSLKRLIKTVVIGGGEPTLKINDVIKLINETENIDWHLFSNGTNKELINEGFIINNCKINISRHAIDEKDNASIFHVDKNTIMTLDDIAKLNEKTEVTLNATCFKGGLDTCDKIMEYINISKKIGIKKVLIQNLQKDLSLGQKDFNYETLYIDDEVFNELIDRFNKSNFHKRYPICSTSGYISYLYKDNDGFQVAIQKYIDELELKKHWINAIKRVYDLSIDPSGNLYENWGQNTNKVNVKKLF